jgi:hypothetical protein
LTNKFPAYVLAAIVLYCRVITQDHPSIFIVVKTALYIIFLKSNPSVLLRPPDGAGRRDEARGGDELLGSPRQV